jgi:hypothetical protein
MAEATSVADKLASRTKKVKPPEPASKRIPPHTSTALPSFLSIMLAREVEIHQGTCDAPAPGAD